ncbi:MAG: magnesium/cobalt transporter CorA [Armatimonadota bacterium]|nr:magnesium/cobalt transporter CorA [Armatimonadota bacterium]MDR7520724.1 magnesium/cobalt transporter CorA [Armatimonadota bacterium]MDR7549578.1 magnesium/cobalt transporter CorA [Armatimonadota bacterium]
MPAASAGMHVLVIRDTEVIPDPQEPLAALRDREGQLLWIDLPDPTAQTMAQVAGIFALHPLAVEDALKRRQRPKAEEYEGFLFITIHAARTKGAGGHDVALDEIDVFYGPAYVITVHSGTSAALEEARRRLVQTPADLRRSNGYLLYVILDAVVDSYFPVLDALDDYIERLEDTLFKRPSPRTLDRLFASKRALLTLRRIAAPQRDIMNVLLRHDSRLIGEGLRAYFRDIYDHLLRITEQIDTHRDLLAGALDIYLSLVSNRLNEIVKVLTIITAIFASLAVITGIYGMNFEHPFPPFGWRYGFYAALGLMVASVAVMLAVFRRLRWL